MAVLGERGVGKSALIAALTGCPPAPTAQQPSFAVYAHEGAVVELLECSLHADYAPARDLLLGGAHAWLVLYASGSKASLARARDWERAAAARHVPVLLLGVVRDAPGGAGPAAGLPHSLPLTLALADAAALRPGAPVHAALAALFTRALARPHDTRRLADAFAGV